jgi:hypothetical protein
LDALASGDWNYSYALVVMLAIIIANVTAEAFQTITKEDALSGNLSAIESHCPVADKILQKKDSSNQMQICC